MLVYLKHLIPEIMKGCIVPAYFGIYMYTRDQLKKKQHPEIVYKTVFYIIFFSLIGHKEARFMLPIAPFLFLLAGYALTNITKKFPKFTRFALWVMILIDASNFCVRVSFHDKFWDAMNYITNFGDKPPHSLYSMHRFETPYYSWLHKKGIGYDPEVNRTKLYVVQQGPSFARKAFGAPLQIQNPDYTSYYVESVARLDDGSMRPEWVLIPERFSDCAGRLYCSQAALDAISSLGFNTSLPMYSL